MYELILSYFAIRRHAKKAARATFHLVIVAWACKQDYHLGTYFYNTYYLSAWLISFMVHCTARRPQQHFVKRAATASLRDQVTRQQKCKLLCLVVFEKGCQFVTVYSGRAVKIPLNRDHGKN